MFSYYSCRLYNNSILQNFSIFSSLRTFPSLRISTFIFDKFSNLSPRHSSKIWQKMQNCSFLVPSYFFLLRKLEVTTTAISHRLAHLLVRGSRDFCNFTTVINQFYANIRTSTFTSRLLIFSVATVAAFRTERLLDVFLDSSWREIDR